MFISIYVVQIYYILNNRKKQVSFNQKVKNVCHGIMFILEKILTKIYIFFN